MFVFLSFLSFWPHPHHHTQVNLLYSFFHIIDHRKTCHHHGLFVHYDSADEDIHISSALFFGELITMLLLYKVKPGYTFTFIYDLYES